MIPQAYKGDPVIVIIARWSRDGEDMKAVLSDLDIQVGPEVESYLGCFIDTDQVLVHRNDCDKVVIEHLPTGKKIVSFKRGGPNGSHTRLIQEVV